MAARHAGLPHGAAIPTLVRWGLSPDADLVYRTLATFGPRALPVLASDLGLPPRRVGVALEELAAVRAVVVPGRSHEVWAPAPPATVLAEVRRRRPRVVDLDEYARRHRAVVGAVLPQVGGLRANHLADRATTRQRIAELIAVERREHLSVNPERSFAPDAARAALPLDRRLLARGVRVRTCGVPPSDGDASCAAARELATLGWDYRERPDVPLKLMVFDRRVALLPADPLDLEAGAFEIDEPAVVGAFIALFEQLWSTARDPRRGGVPPIALTPREQAVLALLAEGHTDSSAAQQLGISRRTIAYTMRTLMDRVGVENRFQLGLALGATRVVAPLSEAPQGDDG
ncbi:DNA-binding CsgD family transcriptional regulator [Saccharothrix tamanrassetensis]|uniref:DNA-binding CsgD family transcriptional regulator n=1 Tax=Saccharothrix tamanrassetensis TaxID=1051531 RepID=A0A841CXU5_9PSEU|nr:helix-turn-helix transcriptional regulator [Saccharothrix tamanrassetensis]MBB5960166.1 DNA-binding CsgD family transcriptional regulator [Saccharothrix tamanrassetensis]